MKRIPDVGIVGLGKIGHGLAKNLIHAGHRVSVCDIVEERVAAAVELGATRTESPRVMAAEAEAIVLSLVNAQIVEEVLLGPDGVCSGQSGKVSVVVDTTTMSPQNSRRFAEDLSGRGIAYLDAPVTGGEGGAEAGTLHLMVGGDEEAYRKCEPVFAAVGSQSVLVGPSGCGSVAKMVNQLMMCAQIAGAAEAFVYTERHGTDPAQVLQAINPKVRDNLWVQKHEQQRLQKRAGDLPAVPASEDHYTPLFLKDMSCLLESDMDLPIARAAAAMLRTAVEGGLEGPFPWSMHTGCEAMQPGESR